MNRLLLIVAIIVFISSCTSNSDNTSNSEKLKSYREQVEELNKKIADIEQAGSKQEYTGLEIPVKVESIVVQPFSHYFDATGELESINEAFISPEINGQIIAVEVNEGQYVQKGQLLARLNTVIIEKSIQEIESQMALAKTFYEKQSALWGKNIGSERQYLESKNNFESMENKLITLKAQHDMAIIKSPINGIVEKIFLKKGELAVPGMQLMQIVNINELYVTLQMSEAHLPVIKKGDIVEISFPSFPELKYIEPVYRTGNVISKQNRTFVVQIKIENHDGKLKPHLLANIKINDYNTGESIVLPSNIIKEDMTGSFIYLIGNSNNNKVAIKKYIKTGVSYLDKTEVVDGLKAGDVIITDGFNNVSNGSVVKIVG
ncbi:MAG: efflux RND transporter periplasmic adaptor subunit [Bacteroidetes bacterium]|nr:efflux RND transporter periplasmic adaptor subunit [Bacteroidota bacterium]MBL6943247.1 efflux RND transporter periplasmic adaptor subunit [Bacteroidales bacterium]